MCGKMINSNRNSVNESKIWSILGMKSLHIAKQREKRNVKPSSPMVGYSIISLFSPIVPSLSDKDVRFPFPSLPLWFSSQGEIDRSEDTLRWLADQYKLMQQATPNEMKETDELMEEGQRSAPVAESFVDSDPSKASASLKTNANADALSQRGTTKMDKRASSASEGSERTPSPAKPPSKRKEGREERQRIPIIDRSEHADLRPR